jgi:RNA polymerase sigma factor (sigma-70 family)
MFRICYRYIGNQMDTEEVVQNGFLKVFQNIAKMEYRGIKQFENWLITIFINESLNFLKRKNIEFISLNEISDDIASEPLNYHGEEDYYQLLLELPIGYRTVFSLYAIEGYSHKEIADRLDISESTSRSQLTKARKFLQKKINGNHGQ